MAHRLSEAAASRNGIFATGTTLLAAGQGDREPNRGLVTAAITAVGATDGGLILCARRRRRHGTIALAHAASICLI
jgi:hypothetical protein